MTDEKNINEFDEEEEEFDTLVLTDEKGNEVEFEFIDLIDYEDKQFIVLLPVEGDDQDQVVIYEVEPCEEDDEFENYRSVDSAETLNAVFEIFKERNKDEFNFID